MMRAPKTTCSFSEGSLRSSGTFVRQRTTAATIHASAAAANVAILMPVAVISDVHANYRALEAVLTEIDAQGVDELWCLGDTVGYGPLPNECCEEVERRAEVCLVGNHDLVVLGQLSVGEFNHEAAAAAAWTAGVLSEESRRFLQRLEPSA